MLYKQGDISPLAVVLGAQSLDDAVTKLDDALRASPTQSRAVVAVTTSAQHASHTAAALVCPARATRSRRAARGRRRSLSQRRVPSGRLHRRAAHAGAAQATADRRAGGAAQQVEQKSTTLRHGRHRRRAPATGRARAAPAPRAGRTLPSARPATRYPGTPPPVPVGWGVVAVDPAVIPLGTRITIPATARGSPRTRAAASAARHRPLVPDPGAGPRLGPPDSHDHAPLDCRALQEGVRIERGTAGSGGRPSRIASRADRRRPRPVPDGAPQPARGAGRADHRRGGRRRRGRRDRAGARARRRRHGPEHAGDGRRRRDAPHHGALHRSRASSC